MPQIKVAPQSHVPICVEHRRKLQPSIVGAYVIEYKDQKLTAPYKVFSCDIYACPVSDCACIVATGLGQHPITQEGRDDFDKMIATLAAPNNPKVVLGFY